MAERFDLDAIEADDALLDLLAAGGESAWEAGEHDPTLKLLAELRLAVEVEGELPVESIDDPESFLARCAALNPVTDPFTRKVAARGLAVGVAAVAALSVSGVAAAVSGDPLAPYEKVIEKVVDGLRPETSFPKEQLDGMPVGDRSKIVQVAKDYQDKIREQRKEEQRKEDQRWTDPLAVDLQGLDTLMPKPPLARPEPPDVDKPIVGTRDPLVPKTEPTEDKAVVEPEAKPTTGVEEPTGDPTDKPSDPPTSEPTEEPSVPPATPSDPPPTTEPSDPPPTPEPTDPNGGGNGQTGGETPAPDPTTTPVPGDNTGESGAGGETGAGGEEPEPGSGDTKPADPSTGDAGDQTGEEPAGDSKPADDTKPADTTPADKPAGDSEPAESKPSLPTTDAPVEPKRLEQYVNQRLEAAAKHSNGKFALGYAKQQYPKGKHSNGQYVEGKHAAFERAHGSMSPVTLRQILWVLNHPTGR
ncbi:hypothetical protein BWI15_14465 [Kribbella sp. ALI-6-A]|uniref:hypothetical protein n=1 Tax=Kribbella sp. ALI-6-A TaxID=1933817 RepID=UPI00097C49DD|nr:hypothetical protein [Kribbella sp. ALI-6-A]ONI71389.1 hypothetical protein BWI15_14465 [Kribbella sp. ALI-6-A]